MEVKSTDEGLKRVVGVPGLALNIVNCTIGAGIFALPAIVSLALGAFSIFGYLFCGLMMATIMLCYAEIGTRVTNTGGSYAYVEAAFGPFPGYVINWLYFFGWSVLGSAALMNLIADSLSVLFPLFAEPTIRALFFFILISTIVMVNVRGAKQGIGFIKFIAIVKLLPLLAIIIFGFSKIETANLQWEHLPSVNTFANATLVLFFAFAGFETSLSVSGELKDPKRTVPLGILFGGLIVLIIYILLQTVSQGILGDLLGSYQDAPLAAVAERIVGPIGATLLLITAAVSCYGTVGSDILTTPRLLFAGARDGFFPKYLAQIHSRFATPHLAVITYGGLIYIFSLAGGFKQLALMASAAILIIYLMVILSTLKLRQDPSSSTEKAFKVPGGFIIPVLGILCILWLLTSLTKMEVLTTISFIAIVSMIYFGTKSLQNKKVK